MIQGLPAESALKNIRYPTIMMIIMKRKWNCSHEKGASFSNSKVYIIKNKSSALYRV